MKKFSINRILFASLLIISTIQTHDNESIEEGFVTFATKSYFPLLKVLLDSVHIFSTRPIVAFGVNDDIPFSDHDYPRLIKKRIDVDLKKISIFYQKPRIIRDSTIQYGIYVEADDIVFDGIDNLFAHCRTIHNLPLCPIHPQSPQIAAHLIKHFKVTQSMPYVHGHVLFSYRCLNFINEWYETCLRYSNGIAAYDETILNLLLWKYHATEYLNVFDPYFDAIRAYQENRIPTEHGYKQEHNIQYYMFHGCKDPQHAKNILNTLVKIHNEK